MKILTVVGARPQFIKLAPVSRAIQRHCDKTGATIEDIIVHTGQHYDHGMSDIFFDELLIPRPALDLGVGSGLHGQQTARMLVALEGALLDFKPDLMIVYGDTNSTLAGALAAAKIHIPVAHIEAGLRSFDRDMPEEVNRIISDHISEILFAPTITAMKNLENENLVERALFVGDVMLDAVRFNTELAREKSSILNSLGLMPKSFAVATLHRANNTDTKNLCVLLNSFNHIACEHMPVVFPVHPRTRQRIQSEYPEWKAHDNLSVIEPVGYLDMLSLLENAAVALTDSGGLQKEALFVGTHCVTLRSETEWPETLAAGANTLAGCDPDTIEHAISRIETQMGTIDSDEWQAAVARFGAGDAADRIVSEIIEFAA